VFIIGDRILNFKTVTYFGQFCVFKISYFSLRNHAWKFALNTNLRFRDHFFTFSVCQYFCKIIIHTRRTFCYCVRQRTGCSISTGKAWISDVGAVLIDCTACRRHQKKTANTKPKKLSKEYSLEQWLSTSGSRAFTFVFAKKMMLYWKGNNVYSFVMPNIPQFQKNWKIPRINVLPLPSRFY